MRLAINEERSVPVDPGIFDVDSGIDVLHGERYSFSASGMWKDGNRKKCDANGWTAPLLGLGRVWNRLPHRNYFLLCLNLDRREDTCAGIGTKLESWDVPAGGSEEARRLYFFANDWPSRYGNNQALPVSEGGPLVVAVKRIG
jgi:hypothetical protein